MFREEAHRDFVPLDFIKEFSTYIFAHLLSGCPPPTPTLPAKLDLTSIPNPWDGSELLFLLGSQACFYFPFQGFD